MVEWMDLTPPGFLQDIVPIVEVFMDNALSISDFLSMGLIHWVGGMMS